MALDKQLIDIQLQGLDTKTDAKLVAPGKMLELENARFEKTGRISKRFGSVALTGAPTTARRIHAFGDSIATINTNTTETASVYSPSLGTATEFSGLAAPMAYIESIFPGNAIRSSGSAWVSASIIAHVVLTVTGSVFVVWFDTTVAKVVSVFKMTLTIGGPGLDAIKIVSAGGLVLVLHSRAATNQSLLYEVTTTTQTLRATLTNLNTGLSAAQLCDMCVSSDGSYVMVAHWDSTSATTMRLWRVTVSGWATTSVTWATASAVRQVAVCEYGDNTRVYWGDAAFNLNTRTYTTSTMANTLATTVVLAGTLARDLLSAKMDAAGTAHVVWQEVIVSGLSAVNDSSIRYVQVNSAGVSSGSVTARTLFLMSKPYILVQSGATRVFVLGLFKPPQNLALESQSCIVLVEINTTQQARARLLYNQAGSTKTIAGASNSDLHQYGSSPSVFCGSVGSVLQATLGSAFTNDSRNENLAVFDYSTSGKYHAVETSSGLLVTGGYLQILGPSGIRENGYLLYPTIKALVDAGVGVMSAGVYSIILVLERYESNGNLVRSAVSLPMSITLAANRTVNVIVQTYCIGSQTETDYIRVYQTVANGSTYYRVPDQSAVNNVAVSEMSITINSTDANVSREEILYTQGGELDNDQPDAPIGICTDKNRVWVFGGTDRQSIAPSKPFIPGYGTSFMPDVYKPVASAGGPLTALARMDGKTFAFKERDIFVSGGEGPDVTGANDTMGDFERLHLESGALGQNYVVRTSNGIMSRGKAGIFTLKRDMSIEYSGAPVESYNSTDLRDCCFVTDTNQAHFALANGVELIYNTEFGQWWISNETKAIAICAMDGVRAFVADPALSATAGVYKQSTGYTDAHLASAAYQLRLLTGWIKFANIQGFMRAYELLIAGNSRSSHSLLVRIAYDYVSTLAETHTMTSANATAGGSAYQLKVKFAQQKCEAFQLEISDVSVFAEGYDIDGLAVLAGIKRGGFKTRAEKVV